MNCAPLTVVLVPASSVTSAGLLGPLTVTVGVFAASSLLIVIVAVLVVPRVAPTSPAVPSVNVNVSGFSQSLSPTMLTTTVPLVAVAGIVSTPE